MKTKDLSEYTKYILYTYENKGLKNLINVKIALIREYNHNQQNICGHDSFK